jgi:hypothetical protein
MPGEDRSLRWGKVQCSIAADVRLDRDHYRIYVLMCGSVKYGDRISNIGSRFIGKSLGLNYVTVIRRQRELAQWGHIERVETKRGERGRWRMLSPVFEVELPAKQKRPTKRSTLTSTQRAAHEWANRDKETA